MSGTLFFIILFFPVFVTSGIFLYQVKCLMDNVCGKVSLFFFLLQPTSMVIQLKTSDTIKKFETLTTKMFYVKSQYVVLSPLKPSLEP